jgi:integrase
LNVSFHGLRHSHLTSLLRAGVHPKIASERAGHASVAITMDVYQHALPAMQDDLAFGVDAAIRAGLKDLLP